MPIYLYQHPKTEEIIEIVQSVNDVHEFSRDGVKWHRIFTSPQLNKDTQIDPFDAKSFIKATDKPDTLGALFDRSAEAAAKRKDKEGIDPIKEKYYDGWSKRRKGMEHPDVKKRKAADKLKKMGVNVSF